MNDNLTDITLVVDKSGSMHAIREDAEGGVNAFLKGQAKEDGDVLLTLVEFDTRYEFLAQGEPLAEVPEYQLQPGGMTALLDAVGRAIDETGKRLSAMEESERPGLVVFAVMTDGHENSSREYTLEQVRKMINQQQEEYDWQFTFLGVDQDAFAAGHGMGFQASEIADVAGQNLHFAYAGLDSKVRRMRSSKRRGEQVENQFTEEERENMS